MQALKAIALRLLLAEHFESREGLVNAIRGEAPDADDRDLAHVSLLYWPWRSDHARFAAIAEQLAQVS